MSSQLNMNRRRRREMERRAAICCRRALQRGHRQACALILVLADYGALSDNLPWPSQKTLAHECGVHERTIRRWVIQLEQAGVLQVLRSKPHRRAFGQWSRRTNRYVLCDRKAKGSAPSTKPSSYVALITN